ncbi:hypothetical protein [Amycolatopsis sp. NPDC051716]
MRRTTTDPETGLRLSLSTTRTTVQQVNAYFGAEDVGADVTLGELRAAVIAAARLPDNAIVRVYAREAWSTPHRLWIEHKEQQDDDPAAVDADDGETVEEYDEDEGTPCPSCTCGPTGKGQPWCDVCGGTGRIPADTAPIRAGSQSDPDVAHEHAVDVRTGVSPC